MTMCWLCGKQREITNHHVIPKAFKPKKNSTIPLCVNCHLIVHYHKDSNYLLKYFQQLTEETNEMKRLFKMTKQLVQLSIENKKLKAMNKFGKKVSIRLKKKNKRLAQYKTISKTGNVYRGRELNETTN